MMMEVLMALVLLADARFLRVLFGESVVDVLYVDHEASRDRLPMCECLSDTHNL